MAQATSQFQKYETKQTFKIACVPEHFSGPVYQSKPEFPQLAIVNCPGGTGQMIKSLQSNQCDAAIALTEGIVLQACKDALSASQNPVRIFGSYVQSPLCWSVAVSPNSNFKTLADLRHRKVGISRFGSGSHIMAIVMAYKMGWLTSNEAPLEFIPLKDIHGLLGGIEDGTIDCFMWEIVTTQPYYNQGRVKMLGSIITPWPSFCLATTSSDTAAVLEFSRFLQNSIADFIDNFEVKGLPLLLKPPFHYPHTDDVWKWFKEVSFSDACKIQQKSVLRECIDTLINSNLLKQEEIDEYEKVNGDIVNRICHEIVTLIE